MRSHDREQFLAQRSRRSELDFVLGPDDTGFEQLDRDCEDARIRGSIEQSFGARRELIDDRERLDQPRDVGGVAGGFDVQPRLGRHDRLAQNEARRALDQRDMGRGRPVPPEHQCAVQSVHKSCRYKR
ncbi:MAG TPA: hypothetical protein VGG28_33260 [Kofleriaceae bacterium]